MSSSLQQKDTLLTSTHHTTMFCDFNKLPLTCASSTDITNADLAIDQAIKEAKKAYEKGKTNKQNQINILSHQEKFYTSIINKSYDTFGTSWASNKINSHKELINDCQNRSVDEYIDHNIVMFVADNDIVTVTIEKQFYIQLMHFLDNFDRWVFITETTTPDIAKVYLKL